MLAECRSQNETNGKTAVIAECEKISTYFDSVTTDFQTYFVIAEGDTVVVSGTGAFLRNGKRFSLISACEVYEFNQAGQIVKIKSFCIEENK
ncbi:MAG: nuclear transport factor 2 family protein [Saprospiraceae bacterium]|nr:nuclear transport factor 2 family protein [Saprospiraceae bacterium]